MKQYSLFISLFILLSLTLSGCSAKKSEAPNLANCINIGNSLEAPKDQPWDVPMNISYFSLLKQAGFQTVRLPVRFSDYVDRSTPDYKLDEAFMQTIDTYVREALNQKLTLILDLHHFEEIMEQPADNKACLIAIWKQLALRYKDYPDTLVFELLNEPQKNLDSDTWNAMLAETVKEIRTIDKKHYLIVGGVSYNSIDGLSTLKLPTDSRLIATFHYYEPNEVTFQGNPYASGFENLKNVTWEQTPDQLSYLKNRLKIAKDWADQNNVPLFLGEFGVTKFAPEKTRITWTTSVIREASALGIDCSYWEFASIFGIYDLKTGTWDNDMLHVLTSPPK